MHPAELASMFPPDPTKMPQYIAAFFKLGVSFGEALVTGIVVPTMKFLTDLGTILS